MTDKNRHPQAVATMLGVLLLLLAAWALPPAISASFGPSQPSQLVGDARPTPTPILPLPEKEPVSPDSPEIPTLPDLIVEKIEVVPTIPQVGETATIKVTIQNPSSYDVAPGNNFWTDLYIDPEVVPVAPGQTGIHRWPCQATWVPAGGSYVLETQYVFDRVKTYSLYAQVDTDGHVQESNENNNMLGPVLVQLKSALISAVYYDTYLTGEPDEAFRLMNVIGSGVDLTNWTATDGEGTLTLQDTLPAGTSVWIAQEADDFTLEFGFPPDYEYGADTDPAVPNLTTSGSFVLANTGDEVVLRDSEGTHVDSVVYEGGDITTAGWFGPPIYPYGGTSVGIECFAQHERDVEAFGLEGQILYRKLDQATGLPVPDTNTAADWAQATDDNINGKKVMYPGWDLERYLWIYCAAAVVYPTTAPPGIRLASLLPAAT
jgi:hypothetical protein